MQVCLSISSHHPEHWQPSWSVRTALVALIAFMQTPGNGAIGSLVSQWNIYCVLQTSHNVDRCDAEALCVSLPWRFAMCKRHESRPAQDYSKEERRGLARKSRAQPPGFGNTERQALTNAAHRRMLEREEVGLSQSYSILR